MRKQYPSEYYSYLSKKLDLGILDSPIFIAFNLCLRENKNMHLTRVVDVGCFNGAMINRLKCHNKNISFIGIDNLFEPLEFGRENYHDISLCCGQANYCLPIVPNSIDIVILSNVLHEIFSVTMIQRNMARALEDIQNVIKNIKICIKENGFLIFQEGLRPPKSDKKIVVEFLSEEMLSKYYQFIDDYFIKYDFGIKNKNNRIEMTESCLSTFLTKVKYIDTDFWHEEKSQLYQFMTQDNFIKLFSELNFILLDSHCEKVNEKYFRGKIMVESISKYQPIKNAVFIFQNKI